MDGRSAKFFAVVVAGAMAASIHSQAAVYCVDGARGLPGATGSCVLDAQGRWSTPFETLGEALAVAQAGDEVWVAEGVYAEDGLVVGSGVALVGGFAGVETLRAEAAPGTRAVLIRAATPEGAETQGILLDPGSRLEGAHVSSGFQALGTAVRLGCPAPGESATTHLVTNLISDSLVGVYVPSCDGATLEVRAIENRIRDNVTGLETGGEFAYGDARTRVDLQSNVFAGNAVVALRTRTAILSQEFRIASASDAFIRNATAIRVDAPRVGSAGADVTMSNALIADNATGADLGSLSEGGTRATFSRSQFRRSPVFGTFDGATLRLERTVLGQSPIRFYGYSSESSLFLSDSDVLQSSGVALDVRSTFPARANVTRSILRGQGVGIRFEAQEPGIGGLSVGGTPATRNAILDSGSACLVNDYDQMLLAEHNFWGTNSAEEIAACVSGPVDYDPWYWPASGEEADGLPRRVYGRVKLSSDPAFPGILHDRPGPGSRISVTWLADTSNSGSAIGSFGGSLRWDPWVLSFVSWQPGPAGFDVVCNPAETGDGILRCSGTNVSSGTGELGLVCATFDVVGPVRWPSPLDVEFTSLYSDALSTPPFEDLTSVLLIEDDYLQVAPAAAYGDVLADDRVDSGDALVLLSREVALPIPVESETRIEERLGDANGDGATDSTDANIILSREIFLPVPRPVGEPNVAQGSCGGAGAAAADPGAAAKPGSATLGLVLDGASRFPQGPFPVRVVLTNKTGERLGSYTAKLTWPSSLYRLVSVAPGGTAPLQRPKSNAASLEPGAVRLTAAHPDGDGSGSLVFAIVTLQATGPGAKPSKDLAIEASAMAGITPSFFSWLPRLTIAPTKVTNPKPR